MKIAIASDWFAPRRGGIEGQLLQLAQRLGSRGNHVDVITSTPGASEGGGHAFRIRPLGVATLPRLHVAVSPALLDVLYRELQRGYDVVHAHVSVVSPVGYAAAAVARALGLPTVVTFHSVLRSKAYLLRAVNAVAGLAQGATIWSGASELVAAQVRRALGVLDVVVLPNGIDLAFWRAPAARTEARQPGAVTLVATMRLHRKKRPRQLLRAFACAASRVRVAARLLIIGDGPERHSLEREIRGGELGLPGSGTRVELRGWLDADQLRSIYAKADGFVLPSRRESFGIAALEARAAGLPVIAMESSGSREFLAHGANALICKDDAELMQSIAHLVSDSELRSRLAKASTSLERYDWDAVVAEHEATYRRAMKRAAAVERAVGASA
jgi:glycosyltransferase involved in cell wall biosynthesis